MPHPLASGALWRDVHAVPPGHAVEISPDGRVLTRRWWQPPARELPLREAAAGLRDALRRAVSLRVRPGEVVGADLSGGMDSTSLCFLAAEAGARLAAVTLDWRAPTNQDRTYATDAARHLTGVEHILFASAEVPAHFSGLDEHQDLTDEPTVALRDWKQQQYLADAMLARGARWRMSGHGGDHVVQPPPAYLHRLLRHAPGSGMRHAAALRAQHRWPRGVSVRTLLDTRSYASWLTDTATQLPKPSPPTGPGWGMRPQLPPWASEQTIQLCRDRLHAAAQDAEPLHHERGRHAWIHTIQQAGQVAGHLSHHAALAGLPVHTPFCDDAVIDAALAARPYEAATPWSYKPLLATALHGLVPAPVLERTTKDHCGIEWHEGLRLHRPVLAAWAGDSRLVAAGLADEEQLHRALLSPELLTGGAVELEATLGAEAWLRDLEHTHQPKEKDVAPTTP
ncbi:asparagine synthase-related protein [Streptomyces iconiensis]|uniref:asparagine synthase (glutamine-hydrolyzing) n=1 Tax=Streptomyces iconiensis TaxID=1384038 RepID=A0ABT7A349_9ACTN|nr:asparagine synthase-related protein [Streptomyces iconiensis]MDJ1135721.1 asparagine synthase-related protein [Streptomyces iconiensis]